LCNIRVRKTVPIILICSKTPDTGISKKRGQMTAPPAFQAKKRDLLDGRYKEGVPAWNAFFIII
jgi:hypothetical protein